MLLQESKASGMAISDIRKRRIWLGESGDGNFYTGDLVQASLVYRSVGQATSRRRRAIRCHNLLYSLRIFSKEGEMWDVQFWRPQHVTLREDSRFPLQGCMQAEDQASWLRYSQLNDAPPQLTGSVPPQGGASEGTHQGLSAASGVGGCVQQRRHLG